MKILITLFACFIMSNNLQAAEIPVDQANFSESKKTILLSNGITIAYTESGSPKGTPLLLIHGYTDNARSWSLMTPYINQNFRIISMDLRGHGKSSAPQCCYTFQDLSYDTKLLLDKLGIEKAYVAGHSLGSIVTQLLAERYPEKVSKIVLISTTSQLSKLSASDGWLATEVFKLKQPIDPNSQFMLDWYTNASKVDDDFLRREREESAAVPINVWRSIIAESQLVEFGRNFNQIKVPTMILHGAKDPLFGEDDQKMLRQALPSAKYVEFPESGHNIMWENPKAVAKHVNDFLSEK